MERGRGGGSEAVIGFLPEDKGPYAFTPNTVELPTRAALSPRGGPVQDPALTGGVEGESETRAPRATDEGKK